MHKIVKFPTFPAQLTLERGTYSRNIVEKLLLSCIRQAAESEVLFANIFVVYAGSWADWFEIVKVVYTALQVS